jgi:hypothetical protein
MQTRCRYRPIAVPLACALLALLPATAGAAVRPSSGGASAPQAATLSGGASAPQAATPEQTGGSLEAAAAKASSTGRTVAMSLIGLALAVAAIVLAFRRDFKEAAGVFTVGVVAVLLATPTGVSLLKDTVSSLFGAR